MINTCKILRVIAIRTYWAEQLILSQKILLKLPENKTMV